jgi:hypothetical protein
MVRISRIVNAGRRIARVFVVGLTSLALVGLPLAAPAADTTPPKDVLPANEAAPKATAKPKVLTSKELSDQQRQVAEKFKRFEQVIKLLAQFSDEADQDQARLLRQVFAESQSRALDGKFEELVKMLQDKRLGQAVGDQEQLNGQLQQLLTMLLAAERDKELKNEQARVKDFIKQIKQMINKQMELEGRTAEADPKSVAPDQGALSDAAAELAKKMAGKEQPKDGKAPKSGDGKPSDGKPNDGKPNDGKPSDPKSGEPKAGDGKPGEPKEGKPGDPKSDKPKDGDSKPSDPKPGDKKPGEGKPSEGKPSEGKPSEGKPSEGKPSEGKPSEGKPSEGKPSEGKPSEGKPSQGKPSQGKPSEGQPQEGESGEQDQQKPSGEKSPMDSPQKRVAAAQQRMAEARKKLEEAKRDNAMKDQEEAIRELEQAKAELEEILRQLREEELARTLEQLERRFTEMLRMQEAVNRDTLGLHNIPVASRGKGEEIESGRLSREEGLILIEADKALAILKEDGTAVAFPRTVEQMRDDIAQVVDLLAQTKVDDLTIAVENDIVLALKELIEALQKAKKDLKDKKQQQQQQQQAGEQQPLIDQIAELKMIRSLQLRVNRRTKLISDTADVSTDSSALEMLKKLSITESDVYRITRDIVLGKNK